MNNMKKLITTIVSTFALVSMVFMTGCKSAPTIGPLVVRQGVATGVGYSVLKYPTAVPYISAASVVVCSAANEANLDPALLIAAIESSNATSVKTPEGVLILNSAFTLYTGIWESYGVNTVSNSPTLKLYLQATCDGLNDGLAFVVPPMSPLPAASVNKNKINWPLVKF